MFTTKEKYEKAALESFSIAQMCRKLNIKPVGGNYKTLKSKIKEYNIDISHFTGKGWNKGERYKIIKKSHPLSEILVENSTYQSYKLKLRLLKEGLKEYKCENPECGRIEWCGKPIKLELHHINGNHFDNRLENLQLLCPNCHSFTETYCGSNKIRYEEKRQQEILENKIKYDEIAKFPKKEKVKKYCLQCGKEINGKGKKYCSMECATIANAKIYPSKEELLEISKQFKSMEEMGRHCNVTGNCLKKWFNKYGIYNEIKSNFKQKTYPIIQFDLDGNFIKEWKDGNEIEKVLGYNKSKIQQVCNGKQKTSYNFIWKYKKDV